MSARAQGTRGRAQSTKKQTGCATSKYRTLRSAWTPMAFRPSNEQIFKERVELICHWFDLWSDGQRKRFMTRILGKCSGMKILFNVKLEKEEVPIEHLDFTTVLPRFLSLYIMSLLDPKTLSRAAQVSWHWKNLADQDCLWMPKCLAQGWYLPYLPSDLECGAWKRHYVQCARSLDIETMGEIPLSREIVSASGSSIRENQDTIASTSPRKSKVLTSDASQRMMSLRPRWMATSKRPADIEWASKLYLGGTNVNQHETSRASVTFHDHFGTLREKPLYNELHGQSAVVSVQDATAKPSSDVYENEAARSKKLLSECSVQRDRSLNDRMASLKAQPWLFTTERSLPFRTATSALAISQGLKEQAPGAQGTELHPDHWLTPHAHPRILLISSKVPAYELLVDATIFGVTPLVYDYDASTIITILNQVTNVLQGRTAECIGLFTEYIEPGEIRICRSTTVSWSSESLLSDVEMFFEKLTLQTLPAVRQGHIDIFVPLPSTDEGLRVLSKLERLSNGESKFLSPLGLTANLRNQVAREWCGLDLRIEQIAPPRYYFHDYKLDIWARAAHSVREAVQCTRQVASDYFAEQHRDLMHRVIGQIAYADLGILKIPSLRQVMEEAMHACLEFKTDSTVQPLVYVAEYLRQLADNEQLKGIDHHPAEDTWSPETLQAIHQQYTRLALSSPDAPHNGMDEDANSLVLDGFNAELHALAAESGTEGRTTPADDLQADLSVTVPDALARTEGDVDEMSDHNRITPNHPPSTLRRTAGLADIRNINASISPVRSPAPSHGRSAVQDAQIYQVDLHQVTARELLRTELAYRAYLAIIKDNFVVPLKRSIQSNRAIIGSGNLHTMFADLMVLYEVSSELVDQLNDRMAQWSSSRFIGDIFQNFCGKLGAFVNYIHNYPTILQIIKKNIESYPQFRAFIARHENNFLTKMLELHELLLVPFERLQEYITLLGVFKSHTPRDHADREIISKCIVSIKDVHRLVREARQRLQLAKRLEEVQKGILHCPHLAEPGRHFILQQDFAVLKPVRNAGADVKIVEKYVIYIHEDDLGLFLFNDALVVAARFQHFVPFQRARSFEYKFVKSLGLRSLLIEDVLDSKYIKNAFKLKSSRHEWILAASSYEKKFDFLTTLESCMVADVPRT